MDRRRRAPGSGDSAPGYSAKSYASAEAASGPGGSHQRSSPGKTNRASGSCVPRAARTCVFPYFLTASLILSPASSSLVADFLCRIVDLFARPLRRPLFARCQSRDGKTQHDRYRNCRVELQGHFLLYMKQVGGLLTSCWTAAVATSFVCHGWPPCRSRKFAAPVTQDPLTWGHAANRS